MLSASLVNGDIKIVGPPSGSDVVSVRLESGFYRVTENNASTFFRVSDVTGGDIIFVGGTGNDNFQNLTGLRTNAKRGSGTDTLVGSVGNDTLEGGLGEDYLFGGGGSDSLYANTASNIGGDTSYNYLNGGDGLDFLKGSDGRDFMDGGRGEDYLFGNGGNDELHAANGIAGDISYNYLDGGAGNDVLYGGDGYDYMIGGAGSDYLYGFGGSDYLYGGSGYDYLYGGDGDDQLDSLQDTSGNLMDGGAANDTVTVTSTAASTPVALNMGGGNDTVTLGGGLLTRLNGIASGVFVNGQAGADAIVLNDIDRGIVPIAGSNYSFTAGSFGGGVKRDGRGILGYTTAESLTLAAGGGSDTISVASTAAATPVVVRAGFGNDVLKVGGPNAAALLGAVTLDGQGGTDTLDYAAFTAAVRVNLAAGTATGVDDGVSDVENVTGGSANDILVGNDLANVLKGGAGRDILIGRGGADALFGEAGDDILIGAATVHDSSAAALEDLIREWARTDFLDFTDKQQFDVRVNHLRGVLGGGLNGVTLLDLSKVVEDGVADNLDGGSDLDWFFKLGADTITALDAAERVN